MSRFCIALSKAFVPGDCSKIDFVEVGEIWSRRLVKVVTSFFMSVSDNMMSESFGSIVVEETLNKRSE